MAQQLISGYKDPVEIKSPSLDEINKRNLKTNTSISGSASIPQLSVYQPDFGALEASMNQILGSYDQFRQATQGQHDAAKAGLDLSLEQSMRNISEARGENKEAFAKSRQQLSEDVYSANRQTQAQMSSRGLAGSGIEAMANLQTRMQAGEAVSDMANEFFDAQTKLVQAETDTRKQYDVSLQNLNSSLQGAMAQIMSQEASTRMDYAQMVDNLKRQVIMDTNAAKQAQYEWQMANQQLQEASKITSTMVQQVLEGGTSDDFKIAALKDFGYSETEAKTAVAQYKVASKTSETQALQKQIDNLIALGSSEKDIQAQIAGMIQQGYDVDLSKLNLNGTTASGAKKTSGIGLPQGKFIVGGTSAPTAENPYGGMSFNQDNLSSAMDTLLKYLPNVGAR